jgi:hypothetical protein
MVEELQYLILGLKLPGSTKGSVTVPVNGDASSMIKYFKSYNSRAEVWRVRHFRLF